MSPLENLRQKHGVSKLLFTVISALRLSFHRLWWAGFDYLIDRLFQTGF